MLNPSTLHLRLDGATVARLTPDQKVGSSNLSRVIHFCSFFKKLFAVIAVVNLAGHIF